MASDCGPLRVESRSKIIGGNASIRNATLTYRPISNLSVVSKLLERIVAKQLVKYLRENDLLPDLQSAYRAHRSTETAVLKVLSDILLALDSGNLAMLTLLDLSATFDSVDHDTLLQRLQISPMVLEGLSPTGSLPIPERPYTVRSLVIDGVQTLRPTLLFSGFRHFVPFHTGVL